MSRYSFFLMLNTVNLPTGSAWGKSALASWTSFHRAFLATRYQRISGAKASGCLCPAATRRFFEMMCTDRSPATAERTQGEYSFQIENSQDVRSGLDPPLPCNNRATVTGFIFGRTSPDADLGQSNLLCHG